MDRSPLQKLSAELRIMIYEIALYQPDGIDGFLGTKETERHPPYRLRKMKSKGALSLLVCCKQLRREAVPVFYGVNKWHIDPGVIDYIPLANTLTRWASHLGPEIANLREVQLTLSTAETTRGSYYINCVTYTTEELARILHKFRASFTSTTMNLVLVFRLYIAWFWCDHPRWQTTHPMTKVLSVRLSLSSPDAMRSQALEALSVRSEVFMIAYGAHSNRHTDTILQRFQRCEDQLLHLVDLISQAAPVDRELRHIST